MATIKDVAEEAKVSPSTVSLVLNNQGRVRPRTLKRIQSAVDHLNYRVKGVGRPRLGLANRKIGIVYAPQGTVHEETVKLTAMWIQGIQSQASLSGAHTNAYAGVGDIKDDVLFKYSLTRELDGVILIGVTKDDGYLDHVLAESMHLVAMNRKPLHNEFSCISMDNYGAGIKVMEYLSELGHERIALISGSDAWAYPEDRWAGARAGIAAYGLKEAFNHSIGAATSSSLKLTDKEITNCCRAVLDANASAAYIMSDSLAIHCLDCWEGMGVSVPNDLSVVGFDNLGLKSKGGLRLTSVDYDKQKMGKLAFETLLDLIENNLNVQAISLTVAVQIVEFDTAAQCTN